MRCAAAGARMVLHRRGTQALGPGAWGRHGPARRVWCGLGLVGPGHPRIGRRCLLWALPEDTWTGATAGHGGRGSCRACGLGIEQPPFPIILRISHKHSILKGA